VPLGEDGQLGLSHHGVKGEKKERKKGKKKERREDECRHQRYSEISCLRVDPNLKIKEILASKRNEQFSDQSD